MPNINPNIAIVVIRHSIVMYCRYTILFMSMNRDTKELHKERMNNIIFLLIPNKQVTHAIHNICLMRIIMNDLEPIPKLSFYR